ncbi:MAG: hypothetical protein ACRC8S_08020 [Fimbriiglobus sp.]
MPTDDDFLREIAAQQANPTVALDAYADWLQAQGHVKREEYVRTWTEDRNNPSKKTEMLKVEKRLKELRRELGDAWCDRVEGRIALLDTARSQAYGELLGRLDAFAAVSMTTSDQLDFAAELWPRDRATDEYLTAYYTKLFESKDFEIIQLRDWDEKFRIRLEDWLDVCLGTDQAQDRRSRRGRISDRDVLLDEMVGLIEVIASPKTVSRISATINDPTRPVPRAFLFEGNEVTLALTLTVVD